MRLLRVMQFSFPFLFKILTFFFFVLLVYAYFGCKLFGEIDKGEIIDEYVNFLTCHNALLTLFKCATGDHWRDIMTDCMELNPHCEHHN